MADTIFFAQKRESHFSHWADSRKQTTDVSGYGGEGTLPLCVRLKQLSLVSLFVSSMAIAQETEVSGDGIKVDPSRLAQHLEYKSDFTSVDLVREDLKRINVENDESRQRILRVPLSKTEMSLLSTVSVASLLLIPLDRKIVDEISGHQGALANRAARFGKNFAEKYAPLLLGLSIGASALRAPDEASQMIDRNVRAIVSLTATNAILKQLFHRALPGESTDNWDRASSYKLSRMDLPSSHAVAAFGIAEMVRQNLKDYPLVGTLAYAGAALTAFSRVHSREHFTSGVVASLYAPLVVRKAMAPRDGESSGFHIAFTPVLSRRQPGFQIQFYEVGVRTPCQAGVETCIKKALQR